MLPTTLSVVGAVILLFDIVAIVSMLLARPTRTHEAGLIGFLPGKDYRPFGKGENDHERGERRSQGSVEGLGCRNPWRPWHQTGRYGIVFWRGVRGGGH